MDFRCPKCGSEHVQSVLGIIQAGTSQTSGTYKGTEYGYGRGFYGGVQGGQFSSTTQTNLASDLSAYLQEQFKRPEDEEPTSYSPFACFAISFLCFWALRDFFWARVVGVAMIGFGISSIWLFRRYRLLPWRAQNKRHEEWHDYSEYAYYCHRCRNIFYVFDHPVNVGPAPDPAPAPERAAAPASEPPANTANEPPDGLSAERPVAQIEHTK